MARISEFKEKAFTKEEFIRWFEDLDDSEIRGGDLSVYWQYMGKCYHCGCPKDNINMKNSPDAHMCIICLKKEKGEEVYSRLQTKLNNWEDKTNGLSLKEKLVLVKKTLMFGG